MRHIRLWGVGAFVAIVMLGALFWLFLVDWIVERAFEEVASEIVGARVDVDRAEVGLFPASVAFHRIQVTDPDEPMTNVFEIRRIAAGLDVLPLLRRKVLIDELAVEGVQLGTPRERSGELPGGKRRTEHAVDHVIAQVEALELPSFDMPDVTAILASEELQSLAIIAEAQERMDAAVDEWRQRIDSLPDEERFSEYQARIEKLRDTHDVASALAAASEVAALQKEVRADIGALQSAMAAMQEQATELTSLATRAAAAPAEDVRRLQDKYGLSPEGLANLSNRLLGPKVAVLTARALAWWQRVEPLVARIETSDTGNEDGVAETVKPMRGRGIDVRFPERNPMPDLLIRKVPVSVELDSGDFSGLITDITPDQRIHGQPLRFSFEGSDLDGLDRVEVRGVLDRVDPLNAADELTIHVAGFAIEAATLSESETWGIDLERAVMNLDLKASRGGEEIMVNANARFTDVRLVTRFADTGAVANAIASTLNGIAEFGLAAQLAGTQDDYALSVSSDMDRILSGAVSNLISGQMNRFRSELSQAISAKTAAPLDALGGSTASFGGLEQEVAKRIRLGDDLLAGGKAGGSGGKLKLPGGLKLPF